MNKVLIGGIAERVESRQVGENNASLLSWTVIVKSEYQRDGQTVESNQYVKCQCWRQKADTYAAMISDGQYVLVSGQLKNRSYEQDGVTKWVTYVEVDDVDAPAMNAIPVGASSAVDDADDELPF
tara:strand:+ start:311 stop:685 length:375 start_codon:yes stop_codon:yes gene_type:complete